MGVVRVGRRALRPAVCAAGLLSVPAVVLAAPVVPACNSAGVVARALPAIVNITVVRVVPAKDKDAEANGSVREKIEIFVGSGFVVDPSGLIVTNKHVIQDSAVIRVTFNDREQVPAKLVAAAALVDLALLKVDMPHPLPTLRFGDSDALRPGQPVIAVGNPIGLGTSVSTGVVSGLNRDLMRTPFDDFIQTDASINPGNSGGPLLNCAGEVIGVNTALLSNSKVLGSIGLGFAMPSNDVHFVVDKLRNPAHVQADWIGVRLQDLTGPLATVFGRSTTEGAIVTVVDAQSPAAHAGLVRGDIITAVDGNAQPDARAILRAIIVQPVGQSITLAVWRRDHAEDVKLRGQEWPGMLALRSNVLASAANVARAEAQGLGLRLSAVTPEARKEFDLNDESGVLVEEITPGSEAATMGLHRGDVIEQVNDQAIKAPQDVMAYLQHGEPSRGDFVALLVRSKTTTKWVTLYVGRIDVADLIARPPLPGGERAAVGNAAAPSR